MTASELANRLGGFCDVPTYKARRFVRGLAVLLRADLERGISTAITGLGTFRVKGCGSRVVKDFRGHRHATPSRKISFKPSKSLRDILS